MNDRVPFARRLVAEGLGTAFLLAVVVGSGIMGERLAAGSVGLALLANALATGAGLVALILAFGPVSGAQLNPLVTLAFTLRGEQPRAELLPTVAVQVVGAVAGVIAAHAMFGLPWIEFGGHARSGAAQWLSEIVASFGLVGIVLAVAPQGLARVAVAVGAYISAAYWFTASTSFANPAVTLARCLTDSFANLRPVDVPGFVVAELIGGLAAVAVFGWLLGPRPSRG